MKKATLYICSKWRHCSQIVAGFIMLREAGMLELDIVTPKYLDEFSDLAVVEAVYDKKKIIYDVMDGYQSAEKIKKLIGSCDFYFKRSYSAILNNEILNQKEIQKIYMLGMNYHVTYNGNPYDKIEKKNILKTILGRKSSAFFVPKAFETSPLYKEKNIKIIFMTRLWDKQDNQNDNTNYEEINENRIKLIRALKKYYGNQFIGGIQQSEVAKKMAPDLIVSRFYTERGYYLKTLKSCDICIGTKGLHESTGWKTAEYVAASKAIINEPIFYNVPGNFSAGKNYLPFSSVDECIYNIEELIKDPLKLYYMKINNMKYYYEYLRPDVLVRNSLSLIEK